MKEEVDQSDNPSQALPSSSRQPEQQTRKSDSNLNRIDSQHPSSSQTRSSALQTEVNPAPASAALASSSSSASSSYLSPSSGKSKMFAVRHHSPENSRKSHEIRLPPISMFSSRSKSSASNFPSSSSFDRDFDLQDEIDQEKTSRNYPRHYPSSSSSASNFAGPQSMQFTSDEFGHKSGEGRGNSHYSDRVPGWMDDREKKTEYMLSQRSGRDAEINEGVRSGNRLNDAKQQPYDHQIGHRYDRVTNEQKRQHEEDEEERIYATQKSNSVSIHQNEIDQFHSNVKNEEPGNENQSVEGGVIRAVSMRDDRESGKKNNTNFESSISSSNIKENRVVNLNNEITGNDRETVTFENQTFSRPPFERKLPQPYQQRQSTFQPEPTRSQSYASLPLGSLKREFDSIDQSASIQDSSQVDAMAANLAQVKEEESSIGSDSVQKQQNQSGEHQQAESPKEQQQNFARLPSISSFHYDDSSSTLRNEGRNLPSINARSSGFTRPTIGSEAQGRTTSFLSSLMRAAGSPDRQSPTTLPSPMSVHTIVTGRSSSPVGNNERSSRKRRTSSEQESLQGSLLESDFRAQSSPRLIDQDSRHSFFRSQTFSSGMTLHSHQDLMDRSRTSHEPRSYPSRISPFEPRTRQTIVPVDQEKLRHQTSPLDYHRSSSQNNEMKVNPYRTDERLMYQETPSHSFPSGDAISGVQDTRQAQYRGDESEYRTASRLPEAHTPTFRHPSQQLYPRGPSSSPYMSNRVASDSTGVNYQRYGSSESPRSMHDTSGVYPYGGGMNASVREFYPAPQSINSVETGSSSKMTKTGQRQYSSTMPSGKYAGNNSSSTSSSITQRTTNFDSVHWNAELSSRALIEQERWSQTPMNEKRRRVIQSVWDARRNIRSGLSYWPPLPSNVTTIRCMYANIAQKSYGSEKRFLCPPPVVKVDGPLRPCKWVSMRVISGDSPTPSVGMATAANNMYGIGVYGSGSGSSMNAGSSTVATGGEEPSILDSQGVARFGKLHVGSISDAISKVFRLQVNLLRAETVGNESKISSRPSFQDMAGPLQLPFNAWSTFHSSPINVISKPARKSVRTRAASPAIASGSIVCLYNRLNSQTVRTKYLGIETGSIDDVSNIEVARKLVARQDGWEGFSIELLARPVNDPAVARANARGLHSDEWGITYGSIVCLRDVNSKLCSDPMLLCKVDKGKVDLSNTLGNTMHEGRIRFQIASRNREEARQILFGGTRGRFFEDFPTGRPIVSNASGLPSFSNMGGMRAENSDGSSADSPRSASTQQHYGNRGMNEGGMMRNTVGGAPSMSSDVNNSVGGPVIQMQKVTLMHVTPLPSNYSADEVECELQAPRSYLCSTVSENAREEPSQLAIARSQRRLQSRSIAVRQGALRLPLDELTAPVGGMGTSMNPISTPSDSAVNESDATVTSSSLNEQMQSPQPQAAPVGFTKPPAVLFSAIGANSGLIDVLEDQYCWTIVTISCTEVSYIEANASIGSNESSSPIKNSKGQNYPHLPLSPLPVTPFPSLAAQPSYDTRTHSLAATIHDYLYADGLDNARSLLNTVSAVHAVPNKAAHEVWIGQSGPLRTHASSAGPHMSDVTIQLPNMEELMNLHIDYHSLNEDENLNRQQRGEGTNIIRLPILFVRISQGITFPSGYWLMAEHISHSHGIVDHSKRSRFDPFSWSFRII